MKLSSRAVLERVGWVPFACIIAAVLVASIAGIAWNTSPYYGHKKAVVAAATPTVKPVPTSTGTYSVALAPTRITIPRLKATAPIVKVATVDGELEIPEDPKVAGWWSPGAKPGAAKGTAVIAGHINYRGVQGTLGTIGKLRNGDTVEVFGKYNNAGSRKVTFRVTAVRSYHKKTLPYREIFDQDIAGRIALVTCGGPFDASTGNYLDNIVVYGVPISASTA